MHLAGMGGHRLEMGRQGRRRLGKRIAIGLAGFGRAARFFEQIGLEQQRDEAERLDPQRAGDGLERGVEIALGPAHGGKLQPGLAPVGIRLCRAGEQGARRCPVTAGGGAVGGRLKPGGVAGDFLLHEGHLEPDRRRRKRFALPPEA